MLILMRMKKAGNKAIHRITLLIAVLTAACCLSSGTGLDVYAAMPAAASPQTATSSQAAAEITLDPNWTYADHSMINTGAARLYRAPANRKNVVVGVNAGHGTRGGYKAKTLCHPDGSPKLTGGSTAAGSIRAAAVSGGMSFKDGTSEGTVTLQAAVALKEMLLADGYDVLMLRDDADVQLDNVARTVIANNKANCLISLHWDGDRLSYDKGCFYISTPEKLKSMEPVSQHWEQHEKLGEALISGLKDAGCKIYRKGSAPIDLTQMSYSTIPSVDVELGNQCSAHDEQATRLIAEGLRRGVKLFYGQQASTPAQ